MSDELENNEREKFYADDNPEGKTMTLIDGHLAWFYCKCGRCETMDYKIIEELDCCGPDCGHTLKAMMKREGYELIEVNP